MTDEHALRFRDTGFGVVYDCTCGGYSDAANDDADAERVYREHAEHIGPAVARNAAAEESA